MIRTASVSTGGRRSAP